jgi:hypothetical protein
MIILPFYFRASKSYHSILKMLKMVSTINSSTHRSLADLNSTGISLAAPLEYNYYLIMGGGEENWFRQRHPDQIKLVLYQ